MKFARFEKNGKTVTGLVTERGLLDLDLYADGLTMQDILTGSDSVKEKLGAVLADESIPVIDPESVSFAAPTDPSKICCIGLNYPLHADEAGEERPKAPIVFCKTSDSINHHKGIIPVPKREELCLDYEAELVVVIGKPGYNIPEEEAKEHIFGYTCGNDVSDRAAQFLSDQHLIGKGCPGFAPMGPYLVTADEADPSDLQITCTVNGELKQDSNTGQMMFDPCYLVSFISKYLQLNTGDVIYTGTPDGVVIGYPPEKRVWLKSGDEVVVEIEKIGRLVNTYI